MQHGHMNVKNPIIICIKFRRWTSSVLRVNIPNSKQQCTSATDRQLRSRHIRKILAARHYYGCWEMISTKLICRNFILIGLSTKHLLVPDIPFPDYTPLPSPWEISDTFTEPFFWGTTLPLMDSRLCSFLTAGNAP